MELYRIYNNFLEIYIICQIKWRQKEGIYSV